MADLTQSQLPKTKKKKRVKNNYSRPKIMIANLLRLPNSGPAPPPGLTGIIYLTCTVCCCRALDKYLGKTLGLDSSRLVGKSAAWPKDGHENLTEEEMNRRIEEEISQMSTEELEAELKKHEEEFPLSEPLDRSQTVQTKRPPIKKDEDGGDEEDEDDDDEDEDNVEEEEEEIVTQPEVIRNDRNGASQHHEAKSTVDEATYRAMKASFESSSFVKPWLDFESSKLKKR